MVEVIDELAALEDPKIHALNEKHGDAHGLNLGKLDAVTAPFAAQSHSDSKSWKACCVRRFPKCMTG